MKTMSETTYMVDLVEISNQVDNTDMRAIHRAISLIALWADTNVCNVSISPAYVYETSESGLWEWEVSILFCYKTGRMRKERWHTSKSCSTSLEMAAREALQSVHWRKNNP